MWILKLLLLFWFQNQLLADDGDKSLVFIKCAPERCWTKLKCITSDSHMHGSKLFKCESAPSLYCCDILATKSALREEEENNKQAKKNENKSKENSKTSVSKSTSNQTFISNMVSTAAVVVKDNDTRLSEFGLFNCKQVLTAPRIVNGQEAPRGKYCFAALLFYGASAALPLIAGCGGTLIASRWVLTAAHCVTNLPIPLTLYRVRLGEHNVTTDPDCPTCPLVQRCGVVDTYAHPAYNPDLFVNDIGLVVIDKPARLDLPNICLGCLPWGGHQFPVFTNSVTFRAVGWGLTEMVTPSLWLREAQLPFVSELDCLTMATPIPSVFCAGGIGTDTCNGDSGGPIIRTQDVVFNGTQTKADIVLGLTSYGPVFCGAKGLAGVYTHIGHFMDWILTMLSNNKNYNIGTNTGANNNNNVNDNNATIPMDFVNFDYV